MTLQKDYVPNLDPTPKDDHPPGGFLDAYLEYTENQESPMDFHFWVGLSLIASILGRKVWFDMGHYKIYPNIFTVLVAESGKLHKSTAINMGSRILKDSGLPVKFFAEKLSPEALIGHLAKQTEKEGHGTVTICAPEFAVFFGKASVDPSLVQTLTDFYDSPDERIYETRSRGKEVCKDICINMLAGSTPAWIRTSLPEESVGGGFASRLLMVYRNTSEKPKIAFPQLLARPDVIVALKDKCTRALHAISRISGPYAIEPAAIQYYQDWYAMHDVEKAPPGMRGYYSRMGDYMLKLGMILAANAGPRRVITMDHLELARDVLVHNEAGTAEVLREMNQSDVGRALERVRHVFLARCAALEPDNLVPVVYKHELIRMFSHSMGSQDLLKVIDTLMSGDEITVVKDPAGGDRVCYTLKARSDEYKKIEEAKKTKESRDGKTN